MNAEPETFVLSLLNEVGDYLSERAEVEAAVDIYRVRAELEARWSRPASYPSNVVRLTARGR